MVKNTPEFPLVDEEEISEVTTFEFKEEKDSNLGNETKIEDVKSAPLFTRLLGANKKGREVLSLANIKVITRASDEQTLSQEEKKQLALVKRAELLYRIGDKNKPIRLFKTNKTEMAIIPIQMIVGSCFIAIRHINRTQERVPNFGFCFGSFSFFLLFNLVTPFVLIC